MKLRRLPLYLLSLVQLVWANTDSCDFTSQFDTKNKTWIQANRKLRSGLIEAIATKFCQQGEVYVQLWEDKGENRYWLVWQTLLSSNGHLGEKSVIPIEGNKPYIHDEHRIGIKVVSGRNVPILTEFQTGADESFNYTVSSNNNGTFELYSQYYFMDLRMPYYFHVDFCIDQECADSDLEIRNPPPRDDSVGNINTDTAASSQNSECSASSLLTPAGRPLVETDRETPGGVLRAISAEFCTSANVTFQVWDVHTVAGTQYYQVVWQKAVQGVASPVGTRRIMPLPSSEWLFLRPSYRLGLHVPPGALNPVQTRFMESAKTKFVQDDVDLESAFPACEPVLLGDLGFPFRLEADLCTSDDCKESNVINEEDTSQYMHNPCIEESTTSKITTVSVDDDPITKSPDILTISTSAVKNIRTTTTTPKPEVKTPTDRGTQNSNNEGKNDPNSIGRIKASSSTDSGAASTFISAFKVNNIGAFIYIIFLFVHLIMR